MLERIAAAGFRVAITPVQLHELPQLAEAYGAPRASRLLRYRAMVAAGLEPAITSDWPVGAPPRFDSIANSFHRLGLAPLAAVAVTVSGKKPNGVAIPHAEARTISLAQALRGITRHGAQAIGRGSDLGRIATGYHADFVILGQSPFDVDPVALYRMPVLATYIAGRRVYDAAEPELGIGRVDPKRVSGSFDRPPMGWTPSPIIGYDPVPGIILGGAFFFYPYEERGLLGNVQLMVVPEQGSRMQASVKAGYLRLLPWLDLQTTARFNNWRGLYYGVGIDTPVADPVETEALRIDTSVGVGLPLSARLKLSVDGLYGFTREHAETLIRERGGAAEGAIAGHRAGTRATLSHDDRDTMFSARRGGRRALWLEGWALQGSEPASRGRAGLELTQFIPLYAPSLILALRGEAATSFGDYAYDTNYAIGGIMLLRGFLNNRFRGHHYAAATTELRFPIWSFISGAAYGESGMVWLDHGSNSLEDLALVGGGGLRFGLPPDFLIKLRFDAGFGRDQWGVFFNFNEAF